MSEKLCSTAYKKTLYVTNIKKQKQIQVNTREYFIDMTTALDITPLWYNDIWSGYITWNGKIATVMSCEN